ncbi:glycosyl hydrolase [Cohnella kolymensis]|uniref:Glycosyl hydrolase n=1 Tax=Cohnella kolymensis TaxID=1590652 RepID=A0ABR5A816_9BACL|nr:glycosyl hydrolase family 18 protein [Cohnella kolymensis]KIL36813.1 glycosyl hydrolase [Cohnella kolymensis]
MSAAPKAGPRRRRRRKGSSIALLLFCIAGAAAFWWIAGQPNSSYVVPSYVSKPHPIMVKGQWTETFALGQAEGLRIPLSVAQKLMGEGVRYEEKTESIILTTSTKVLHFKTGELEGSLNRKPFALRFAAEKKNGELYLPIAPLTELFGVKAETAKTTSIITLMMPGDSISRAVVPSDKKKGIKLREGPDKSFAIIEDLASGAGVRVWGESEGWYKAQSSSGHIGYVPKESVNAAKTEKVTSSAGETAPFVAWKGTGKKINLTWEAVYGANPDTRKIGDLPGVNVVSPTWFELLNGNGDIKSNADAGYSAWARAKGMQVWGLFSNGFEPDRTHAALGSYETRLRMIQQLLVYAKTFRLQGINIDFENVYTHDKENLVQFVREMTPLLHQQNLIVSIDVTPKSSTEMWSVFLDRQRLGQIVDFMMVMAYDEHWAASPVAGSVSSLGWAEKSVQRILSEDNVPAGKLLLGIPLYMRLWTEEPDGNGGVKVSSKTLSMESAHEIIKEKKLKPSHSAESGQNYVEYRESGTLKRIWIEDAFSIKARAALAKKYDLAGVASWRRGFESSDIWGVLDKTLQSSD